MRVILCWKHWITTKVVLKAQKSLTRGKERKEEELKEVGKEIKGVGIIK